MVHFSSFVLILMFCYTLPAHGNAQLTLPEIPRIETYSCNDKTEKVLLYLEGDAPSKKTATLYQIENEVVVEKREIDPSHRYSFSFLKSKRGDDEFTGEMSGPLAKATALKAGQKTTGSFSEITPLKNSPIGGLSTKVWKMERKVSAAPKASLQGRKWDAYWIEETATLKEETVIRKSLFVPELSVATEHSLSANGKVVSCSLKSFTKVKKRL